MESAWLDRVLTEQADATYTLVFGHHPVFPINGFSGAYQRELAPDEGEAFWRVLVRHGVCAYWCSHILAFDVQVREGVLQIVTAGAGTAHRMPEESEYLHAMQATLDAEGLRYQVLDTEGAVREWLAWPLTLPAAGGWPVLPAGEQQAGGLLAAAAGASLVAWEFTGFAAESGVGEMQTLLAGWNPGPGLASPWIGLLGPEQRLGVLISPAPGRSPHLWLGPLLEPGRPFGIQVAFHGGMGPGGLLWRWDDAAPWSSLAAAAAWGAERLVWPVRWAIGHDRRGPMDRPFRGAALRVRRYETVLPQFLAG